MTDQGKSLAIQPRRRYSTPKALHFIVEDAEISFGICSNLGKKAYASMRPFGRALTYSLESARLREDGYATWEEEDYCSPPLAQERAAVLDEFFEELDVTRVPEGKGWKKIEALPPLFPELAGKPRIAKR